MIVVSELVANSVRHTESNQIEVGVHTVNGHVRVEVADSGPGFQPDSPIGNGLGLSIVERIADRWGFETKSGFRVWAEIDLATS